MKFINMLVVSMLFSSVVTSAVSTTDAKAESSNVKENIGVDSVQENELQHSEAVEEKEAAEEEGKLNNENISGDKENPDSLISSQNDAETEKVEEEKGNMDSLLKDEKTTDQSLDSSKTIEEEIETKEKPQSKSSFTQSIPKEQVKRASILSTAVAVETNISKLGHLNSDQVRIYSDYKKLTTYQKAGTKYTNEVYYIKKQVKYENVVYYLISRNPSSTSGVVGWVKATDMATGDHKTLHKEKNTFYLTGTGKAYSKTWGGTKNEIDLKLSTLKNAELLINLTEQVGKQTWYRGTVAGKTVWIEASQVSEGLESAISKMGHINSTGVRIYKDYSKQTQYTQAGATNTEEVFYIKKEAVYKGSAFYLISRNPSSTTGVVGWVKATDMATGNHKTLNKDKNTFYLTGSGNAYTKAWGGVKNQTNLKLSTLKNAELLVNLTEQVGDQTWYRGTISGQTVWVEAGQVSKNLDLERAISKMGHVNSASIRIYKDYAKQSSYVQAGTANTDEVFYIKKEALYDGVSYYLISRNPSSTSGVVGWVKAADIDTGDHKTLNKDKNTFYLTGSGYAYTKAWGGTKNRTNHELAKIKDAELLVNLTEQVGNQTWYRGTVAGETIWVEAAQVSEGLENTISKMGYVNSASVRIYKNYTKQDAYAEAGTANTNEVFYIKKEAVYKGSTYYLISRNPSSTAGVVGWAKAADMKTGDHKTLHKEKNTFYLTGSGFAYSKAWGGTKNQINLQLSSLKNVELFVNLTEQIGDETWYRGTVNGQTVWVEAGQVSESLERTVSKMGHINSSSVRVYDNYTKQDAYAEAGTANTNEVFYIKKEAVYKGSTYYLISRNPSSTAGVVGWAKAADMKTGDHKTLHKEKNTFYLTGTGFAYSKAWGGTKNQTKQQLSTLKNKALLVNLTEQVGDVIWYRGTVNGQTVWVQESQVTESFERAVSKMGHVYSTNVRIYSNYEKQTAYTEAGTANTEEVFYIKKEALYKGGSYYLISRNPSSTSGVVGWVKSTDLATGDHKTLNKDKNTFLIKGTGSAFTKAWGGTKNQAIEKLSSFKKAEFKINLTEKVGNDLWYRGDFNGKNVWIQEDDLIKVETKYSTYNSTFNEALTKQMKILQQTDKYANNKAYVASSKIKATIKSDKTNLRSAAKLASSYVAMSVNKGTAVTILEEVTGDLSSGSTRWYKIKYANKTLYAHSSVVSTATTEKTNVVNASNTGHVFGTLAAGTNVTLKKKGTSWDEISYDVWRNPTQADVTTYLEPGNNDKFQHLLLTSSAGVTATELNKILVGKGSLTGQGQAFINGGKQYNVNEIYLISHALLESGQGKSSLANGVEVGKNALGTPTLVTVANRSSLKSIQKTYNMFGIGAVDGNALAAGAIRAYSSGWFTPEAAIVGGAQFVGTNYLNKGQDTLYKMRWNPANPATHQYASDIGWAAKQTVKMNSLYDMLDSYTLTFDIPKYK